MNTEQLSFAFFCIENIAERLEISGNLVYKILTENSNILDNYIIPCTDALHTQGKEYILNDLLEYMREERLIK